MFAISVLLSDASKRCGLEVAYTSSAFTLSKRSFVVVVEFLVGVPIDFSRGVVIDIEIGCPSPCEGFARGGSVDWKVSLGWLVGVSLCIVEFSATVAGSRSGT